MQPQMVLRNRKVASPYGWVPPPGLLRGRSRKWRSSYSDEEEDVPKNEDGDDDNHDAKTAPDGQV